jgi:pimeloyl-ACP methyl ester carboxylesterase
LNNWTILFIFLLVVYLGVCLIFYNFQESFLFHPRKTAQDFVYEFNYPFEEQWYDTPNQGRIHSLTFKAEDSKGVIFYLHGNAGSLRDWGWVYADFIPRAYDLVIIDYRGYGKSTGKLSESNMVSDASFVFESLKQAYSEQEIIIYGRSIGTGVAVQLAAQQKAKALVLESPYYSISDIAKVLAPIFPTNLLLRFKFESFKFLKDINYPIYILHGEKDVVVPFTSGKKLAYSFPEGVKFYSVEEGQHNDLSNFSEFGEMLTEALK